MTEYGNEGLLLGFITAHVVFCETAAIRWFISTSDWYAVFRLPSRLPDFIVQATAFF
jgi:hypothetical protein